jgi:WD40 repeat protein
MRTVLRRLISMFVILVVCLPSRGFPQWTDLTKPPEPKKSSVPEITPKLTALTHSYEGQVVSFSPDGKLLFLRGGLGALPPVPKASGKRRGGPVGSAAATAIAAGDEVASGSNAPTQYRSPGGRYLGKVVPESTGSLLLESESGRLAAQFPTREQQAVDFALREWSWPVFSPKGATLVGMSRDHLIVWDVEKRDYRPRVSLPAGFEPKCFAFSPDASRLLVYGRTRGSQFEPIPEIYLFDAATGRPTRKIETKQTISGEGIEFSPDGKRFALGFALWDVESGKMISELPKLEEGQSPGHCKIKFAPDGRTIVGYDCQKLLLWDSEANRVEIAFDLQRLHRKDPDFDYQNRLQSIAFSPDGKWMVGTDGEIIRLWHFSTRNLVANLMGHVNRVTALAFSPDGKTVASASTDCTTRLWDVGRLLASIPEPRPPAPKPPVEIYALLQHNAPSEEDEKRPLQRLRFSHDGKTIAASTNAGTILLWDVKTRQEKTPLPVGVREIASAKGPGFGFVPNGTLFVVLCKDRICVLDLATGKIVRTLREVGNIMSVSADGQQLAFVVYDADLHHDTVRIYDLNRGRRITEFKAGRNIEDMKFSPDGKYLAIQRSVPRSEGGITIRSTDSWKTLATSEPMEYGAGEISFSADGRLLRSQQMFSVRFWEVPTLEVKNDLKDAPSTSDCTGDFTVLAGKGSPDMIQVWDCTARKRIGSFGFPPKGQVKSMDDCAFSPDGTILATVHDDINGVVLWNWRAALQENRERDQ